MVVPRPFGGNREGVGMELQAIKAAGLRELARKFRARAAEGGPGIYCDLMLRSAVELEEFAASMENKGDPEFVLVEVDDKDDVP